MAEEHEAPRINVSTPMRAVCGASLIRKINFRII